MRAVTLDIYRHQNQCITVVKTDQLSYFVNQNTSKNKAHQKSRYLTLPVDDPVEVPAKSLHTITPTRRNVPEYNDTHTSLLRPGQLFNQPV